MAETKMLHNKGNFRIDHKYGSIMPKDTVGMEKDYADYLRSLFPNELMDLSDATKIFYQGVAPDAKADELEKEVALEDMTVAQLRKLASDRDVAIPAGAAKADIVALLSA